MCRTMLAALVAVVALGAVASAAMGAVKISATPSSTEPYYACPAPAPGYDECDQIVEPARYDRARTALGEIKPDEEGTGELGGWSPENLRSAYKLPAKGGAGETVAIVDAYNYPSAEADLKVYREHYGLSACTRANGCFKKVNQKGEAAESETAAIYPESSIGWSKEMSLDLAMVSAVCQECKLLLVEANNNTSEALDAAEDEAASLKPVAISNSWGISGEEASETEEDVHFDHPGIPIVFSGGDSGYGAKYPASSHYVIAVGGTQLTKEPSSSRGWSEEVWKQEGGGATGSGCSKYEPKPAWQTDKGCAKRTANDVSAVAYHLSAYDSYERAESERWSLRTGTSASAPIIAGVEALSSSYTRSLGAQAFWVAGPKGLLFDITKGNDGTCTPPAEHEYLCTAETGYDGPTGSGTPDGPLELPTSPLVTTEAASAVDGTQAVLHGTVNPDGADTHYDFEYGTTTSYGKTIPVPSEDIGSGLTNVSVQQTITGLSRSTTYHFRLVASNVDGTTDGADKTLTTTSTNEFIVEGKAIAGSEKVVAEGTMGVSTLEIIIGGAEFAFQCTKGVFKNTLASGGVAGEGHVEMKECGSSHNCKIGGQDIIYLGFGGNGLESGPLFDEEFNGAGPHEELTILEIATGGGCAFSGNFKITGYLRAQLPGMETEAVEHEVVYKNSLSHMQLGSEAVYFKGTAKVKLASGKKWSAS